MFSIIGSNGFIGSNLVKRFNEESTDYSVPDIEDASFLNKNLGDVIYTLGVSDFKKKPYRTVDAHVCILRKILENGRFDSFLYFSSGRIYYNGKTSFEDDSITVNSSNIDDLYNISKLLGESLCISSKLENVRIVRPSNVTGNSFTSNLFIPSIIKDAIKDKKIVLHSSLDSEKDYVYIDDLTKIIPEISLNGKEKIYNIAYGQNTKTKSIVDEISRITNCSVEVAPDAQKFSFPQISIERIKNEFNFKPASIIDKLENMVKSFENYHTKF